MQLYHLNCFRGHLALKIVVNLFLAPTLPLKQVKPQKMQFYHLNCFRGHLAPKIVVNLFLALPCPQKS